MIQLFTEGEDVVIDGGEVQTVLSKEEARDVWLQLSKIFEPTKPKRERVEEAPAEHPDARIERLYLRRIEKGLTPGRAVHYCTTFVGTNTEGVRAALARRGIVVEDGRKSSASKRWEETRPKPPKPVASVPRRKVTSQRPAEPIVRREYTDEGGCVMLDPRDLLASMPGYGQPGRYVHPADLSRRP